MTREQHRSIVLACQAILLLAPFTSAAIGGRAGGGGARTSFTAAPTYRPATAAPAPAFRPATAGAGGAAGAAAYRPSTFGGSTPFSYNRAGYRSTPLFLPFAAGALAGTALYSLNSNRNAYCNGFSVQCYKTTCQNALAQCKDTNSSSLVTAACPDNRFTECWQSSDQVFQCFGRRRPQFGDNDIAAYCNQPVGSNSAGRARLQLVSAGFSWQNSNDGSGLHAHASTLHKTTLIYHTALRAVIGFAAGPCVYWEDYRHR